MTPHPRSRVVPALTLCVVALLGAACSSAPETTAPPVTATSPAGAGAGTVVTPEAGEPPLPAIERVEREIAREGLSAERAKLLFSLTVGPLPGVTLPDGERGPVEEVTLPILYISSVWNDLTEDQRRAAARHIGWEPEEGNGPSGSATYDTSDPNRRTPGTATVGTTPAGSTPRAPRSPAPPRRRVDSTPMAVPAAMVAPPFTDSAGTVMDADYFVGLGAVEINAFDPLVGMTIPGFTVTTHDKLHPDPTKALVHAQTARWHEDPAGSGQIVEYPRGFCNIDVYLPNFQGQTDLVNRSVMAHEVFHCYQFAALGTLGAAANAAQWLMEGGASWAQLQVLPISRGAFPKMDGVWDKYSLHPETHLFEHTYGAVGFLGHVGDVRGGQSAVWPLLLPATVASTGMNHDAAFNLLVAGLEREVLDSWGASFFRFTDRSGWTMTGPGPVDGARIRPENQTVAARGDVTFKAAAPWEIETTELNSSADIVKITTTKGNVRMLDGPRQRQVTFSPQNEVSFCLKGTCTCPPGTSGFDEQTISAKAPFNIALTGGRAGAGGYAQGFSLDDFCKKPSRPAPSGGGGAGSGGGGGGGGGGGNPGGPGGPPTGSGNGRSKGDPHITTFDGRSYGFQAVGEYVLARSTTDDLEVQVRQEPFTGRRDVSVNTAVAAQVGDDRVTVTLEDQRLVLRVDANTVDGDFRALDGGSARRIATSTGDGYGIEWDDGSVLDATPIGPYGINVHLVPADERRNEVEGLLGNFDDDPDDDLVVRGGDRRIDPLSRDDLYRDFKPSWSVGRTRSLFDYRSGTDSATFDDPGFPDALVDPRNVPGRAEAERTCREAGISDPLLLEECTMDLALTGKSAFLNGYAVISRTIAAEGGATTGSAVRIEGDVTDRAQQPEHRFDASEGDVMWVGSDQCEDAAMPTRLTGPDGQEVFTRPGCQIKRFEIPRTGSYTLTLNIFGEKTGRYRFLIEPVRHDRTADVAFGDELTGTIDQPAAHDVYRLEARAGDVLSISPPDCEDGRLSLTIEDAQGAPLSVTTGCQTPEVRFARDGTYTITVNDIDSGTGSYRLPLRKR